MSAHLSPGGTAELCSLGAALPRWQETSSWRSPPDPARPPPPPAPAEESSLQRTQLQLKKKLLNSKYICHQSLPSDKFQHNGHKRINFYSTTHNQTIWSPTLLSTYFHFHNLPCDKSRNISKPAAGMRLSFER